MSDNESPFVPGARVAIRGRYNESYREGFVDKVYKSRSKYHEHGNITLRGSPKQYRVNWSRGFGEERTITWSATSTGEGYYHDYVYPWNEKIDQEIIEQQTAVKRGKRIYRLERAVKAMRNDNASLDGFLDTIEEFELYKELAPLEEKSKV